VEGLARGYLANLRLVIAHCREAGRQGGFHTPSDHGLGNHIRFGELDAFMDELYRGRPRREQVDGLYRLSGLQAGMLFHGLYDESVVAYVDQFACDLISPDLAWFDKSWRYLIDRHSILRTAIYYDAFPIPVQCVYKQVDLPIGIIDYRHLSADDHAVALQVFGQQQQQKGFDFRHAPLMRIALVRLTDDRYRMFWTFHHILLDGWSLPILVEEFLTVYESFSTGSRPDNRPQDRYEDYIRYIDRRDKQQEETYWRNYLAAVTDSTLLPFIAPGADRNKGIGTYREVKLSIAADRTAVINEFARQQHLTVNTIMQGIWAFLLHTYTAKTDIVYGVTVSGRPDELPGVEERVGIYINTIPLHTSLNTDTPVTGWLQTLQQQQVESRQYQYSVLSDIQKWIGVPGDLFDSVLVFENYPVGELVAARPWALRVQDVMMQEQTNYPLCLVIGMGKQIDIVFSYNAQLLDPFYVTQISEHFDQLLGQLMAAPQASMDDWRLLTPERLNGLRQWEGGFVGYPRELTLTELFHRQVIAHPDNIAVCCDSERLTYRELDRRSWRLAAELHRRGVGADVLVPVCTDRSADMIVAALGVLKAGGAYVPIDPGYPEDRIRFIIGDTQAVVAVADDAGSERLRQAAGTITVVNTCADLPDQQITLAGPQPHHLAYIIYTSGSSGQPKGVLITHANVVRLFVNDQPLFDFSSGDVWTLFHSFCFDFSVWEMYGALLFGGRLVIVPREVARDTPRFAQLLLDEQVSILSQTPSAFYGLQEHLAAEHWPELRVRQIIFGGEALNPARIKDFHQAYAHCQLINMYGITETTVHVTYRELGAGDFDSAASVIGTPIPTLRVLVLDEQQRRCPVGVAGEIHVEGDGLARGYLNRPELTGERFVELRPDGELQPRRLYKSGDLARWLANGELEYLGRRDEQVKIRGYRIELGEIETALLDSGTVSQAVVVCPSEANTAKRLLAYVVPGEGYQRPALSAFLQTRLPDYMQPALITEIDQLPLTGNGKIDRKALPKPGAAHDATGQWLPPQTETEQLLASIWKDLLDIDRVGLHDNFFELGGDSLSATRVISAIQRQSAIRLPVKLLFQLPTLQLLARYLESIVKEPSGSEEMVEIKL
jgi:amino acid adenylation domain-containing protein